MNSLRILMISDFEAVGGAAIAATRLAAGLRARGNEVVRVVHRASGGSDPQCIPVDELHDLPERLRMGWISLPWRMQQSLRAKLVRKRVREIMIEFKPAVISVHNLHGGGPGWDWGLVKTTLSQAPVAWTLHDMWSFTGRCACSYECRKFVDGCDASCPTAGEYPSLPHNRIQPAWNSRARLFREHPDLVAITPSDWLGREAEQSFWNGHRIEVIRNPLSLDTYHPVDKQMARKALGIPDHTPVVLVVAQNLSERRNGGELLPQVLGAFRDDAFHLVTMGSRKGWSSVRDAHVTHLDYIDFERAKVLAYSCADLFLHPALVDNLPNTVAESLSCGTPVVALPVGGVPEMVIPGQTGWLARESSSDALVAALRTALEQVQQGLDLRGECRSFAEKNYAMETQTARYEDLFHSLLRTRNSN